MTILNRTKARYIALDLDGVLTDYKWLYALTSGGTTRADTFDLAVILNPERVALLNQITDTTGAELVVSSTWRLSLRLPELRTTLRLVGVTGLVRGVTPHLPGKLRGEEIQAWFDTWGDEGDALVILDDDSGMAHLSHLLVKTNGNEGLQPHHVHRAIEILRPS